MKKYVLLLSLALTACVTPEQRAQQQIAHCTELGFQPGTDGFGNCRLQLEQMHVSKAAALMGANANNAARARTCNTFGSQTTCY